MTRAHGTGADGAKLDLIGQPLDLRTGPAPGIHFMMENGMPKATHDGKYTLNGVRYLMRAGQVLPEGAVPDPVDVPEPETREDAEPETKVEKAPRAPKAKAKD